MTGTITHVVLITGKPMTPDSPEVGREHMMNKRGITFFLPWVPERIHVPWTSILYLEAKP